MRIGFHFPFAGGLIKLMERIKTSGGNTYQIYSRGIRGGDLKELHQKRLKKFMEFQKDKRILPVIHAPYTFNLANLENEDELKVLEDLQYINQFKSAYYVMNPGRSVGQDPVNALENVRYQLWDTLNKTDWYGEILIKNSRGAGTEIGYDLRDWKELITFHPQVKGALDLSWLKIAGYEFETEESAYDLVEAIEDYIGWENIKLLYINDTNLPLGSRKEDKKPPPLGLGTINFNGYQHILKNPIIQEKIWIVEHSSDNDDYWQIMNFLVDCKKSE